MTSCVIIFTHCVKFMTQCYIILEEADRMSEPHGPRASPSRAPSRLSIETVLTPAALSFVAKLQRTFDPRRRELLQKRAERQQQDRSGRAARFSAGDRPHPIGSILARRAHPARSATPPRRNHRPHRAQDADQRAQLGGRCVYGGLRRCQLADVGQPDAGAHQPARSDRAHDRVADAR